MDHIFKTRKMDILQINVLKHVKHLVISHYNMVEIVYVKMMLIQSHNLENQSVLVDQEVRIVTLFMLKEHNSQQLIQSNHILTWVILVTRMLKL